MQGESKERKKGRDGKEREGGRERGAYYSGDEIISWCPPQSRRTKNGSELVFHKVSWTLEEASPSPARNCRIMVPGRRSDQVILTG